MQSQAPWRGTSYKLAKAWSSGLVKAGSSFFHLYTGMPSLPHLQVVTVVGSLSLSRGIGQCLQFKITWPLETPRGICWMVEVLCYARRRCRGESAAQIVSAWDSFGSSHAGRGVCSAGSIGLRSWRDLSKGASRKAQANH